MGWGLGGCTVSSPPRQMLTRPRRSGSGTRAFHEDEPTFNYEHKQSDLDEPRLSRSGLKDEPDWGQTCGRLLWKVAVVAADPVSQSEGISPARGAPAAVLPRCCSLLKNNTWGIIMQETPQNPRQSVPGLSTFNSDVFGRNYGLLKCPRPSSVGREVRPLVLLLFCFFTIHASFAKAGWCTIAHVSHFFAQLSFKQINYRRVYGCKDKGIYTEIALRSSSLDVPSAQWCLVLAGRGSQPPKKSYFFLAVFLFSHRPRPPPSVVPNTVSPSISVYAGGKAERRCHVVFLATLARLDDHIRQLLHLKSENQQQREEPSAKRRTAFRQSANISPLTGIYLATLCCLPT